MKVGDKVRATGYFTKAIFLRGQSSLEVERRIGYRRGRLSAGWWLLFLERKPMVSEFEFRGYSQMSGGISQGHLPNPSDPRTAEQRLRDSGSDLGRQKTDIVNRVFTVTGANRLAKVIPIRGEFGESDYPPGSGIPQWTLTRNANLQATVVAKIEPGEMYLGNYL